MGENIEGKIGEEKTGYVGHARAHQQVEAERSRKIRYEVAFKIIILDGGRYDKLYAVDVFGTWRLTCGWNIVQHHNQYYCNNHSIALHMFMLRTRMRLFIGNDLVL